MSEPMFGLHTACRQLARLSLFRSVRCSSALNSKLIRDKCRLVHWSIIPTAIFKCVKLTHLASVGQFCAVECTKMHSDASPKVIKCYGIIAPSCSPSTEHWSGQYCNEALTQASRHIHITDTSHDITHFSSSTTTVIITTTTLSNIQLCHQHSV